MSITLILAMVAFSVGFSWGFKKPTGYCSMSTAQQHGFGNRFLSGLINGVILAGIAAVLASIAFG